MDALFFHIQQADVFLSRRSSSRTHIARPVQHVDGPSQTWESHAVVSVLVLIGVDRGLGLNEAEDVFGQMANRNIQ